MVDFLYYMVTHGNGSIDWLGLIIAIILGLLVLFFISLIVFLMVNAIGYALVDEHREKATIINKYYSPAKSSSGIGMGYTTQGIAPVVTNSYESESFTIEIELKNKIRTRTDVSRDYFDQCSIGDTVVVGYKIAKWTESFSITNIYENQSLE